MIIAAALRPIHSISPIICTSMGSALRLRSFGATEGPVGPQGVFLSHWVYSDDTIR